MAPRRFTHLLKHDAALLEQFLNSFPNRYTTLDFDVQVGDGRDPGPDFDQTIRDMAISLSRRRIDCVGFRQNSIDLIEVTQEAGLTAVGQLHAYPVLFSYTFTHNRPLVPLLLARRFQTDMEKVIPSLTVAWCLISEDGKIVHSSPWK
jgi:hypothetical protein